MTEMAIDGEPNAFGGKLTYHPGLTCFALTQLILRYVNGRLRRRSREWNSVQGHKVN